MFDLRLLSDPLLACIVASHFLAFLGLYVPYVYMVDLLAARGFEGGGSAGVIVSSIGIANTVGRVAAGWLADMPQVRLVY